MYQRIKQLGLQSTIYGLGGILNQLVGIILIPLYTKELTPQEYGVVQLLNITALIISILARLGLGNAIFKIVLFDQESEKRTIYSTAFITLSISALITFVFGWFYSEEISSLLFETNIYSRLVSLTFLATALDTAFVIIGQAYLRIEQRAFSYSMLNLGAFSLRLILNVLLIAVLHRGAEGLVEANALQSLVFAVIYFGVFRQQIGPLFTRTALNRLLNFGVPLVPGLLASNVLVLGDRYFLSYYSTLSEVGIYSLGYRIASTLSLVVGAFQTAWPAIMFSVARSSDGPRFISRVLTYMVFVQLYLALGLSALIDEILIILTSEAYYSASQVVPLIAISYVFYGAFFVTSSGTSIRNKTIYTSLVVVCAALIQTSINFYLIPRYGMKGAAVSTALSYLLLPILSGIISNWLYPVQYEFRRILGIAIIAVGLFILSQLIQLANVYLSFIINGLIAASFPVWIWIFGLVQKDEQHAIQLQFLKAYRYIFRSS